MLKKRVTCSVCGGPVGVCGHERIKSMAEIEAMVRATPPDVRDLRSLIERVVKEPHLVLDAEWRADAVRLGCQL